MSLKRFFRRSRWDEERARELDAHLAIETDENIARGMTPQDARLAACRKLGSAARIREEIYDFNTVPIDIFIQVVPVLDFFSGYARHSLYVDLDASIGVRYWFN